MSATFRSALVSLIAAAVIAPAALAQTPADTVSVRVAYGDLDMSTRSGGAALLKRIKAAARKICDTRNDYNPLPRQSWSTCRHVTVENTVRRLDIASLTAALDGGPASQAIAAR